ATSISGGSHRALIGALRVAISLSRAAPAREPSIGDDAPRAVGLIGLHRVDCLRRLLPQVLLVDASADDDERHDPGRAVGGRVRDERALPRGGAEGVTAPGCW